jgi:hypothetical protein
MRSFLLLFCSSLICLFAHSQWTTTGTTIYNSNTGNVGIGTSTPGAKLEVAGPALLMTGTNKFYFYEVTNVDRALAGIRVNAGNPVFNAKDNGVLYLNRDVNADTYIESAPDGINNIEIATFKKNGNVGIGTLNPQAKLAVNGDIVAKQMTVTLSGWSDYVFYDDYRLPSLASVAKYIHFNKHLPDVPSATEVETKGVDLGASQAILLKKIEELTLYMIQQKKELDAQRKKIARLERMMASGTKK